jgi:ubiquinone/menaquinone biosynthesis C-methylase UbiE
MISTIEKTLSTTPTRRRALIRFWYETLSRLDRRGIMRLMNYGYADPAARRLPLDPPDEGDRYALQLYHHVASGIDLQGRDLLEVGCGRGGGASFVLRQHRPHKLVGLDFSLAAIRFCQGRYHLPGLSFVPGDAEALPFAEASFDAVINIESSHCYPSFERFLAEVRRVLRPGGHLLYADFRPREQLNVWREQITGAGFTIVQEQEITPAVVRALDADDARKRQLIARHAPPFIRTRFAHFAGLHGSPIYEQFRSGERAYMSIMMSYEL